MSFESAIQKNSERIKAREKKEQGEGYKRNLNPEQIAYIEKAIQAGPRGIDDLLNKSN